MLLNTISLVPSTRSSVTSQRFTVKPWLGLMLSVRLRPIARFNSSHDMRSTNEWDDVEGYLHNDHPKLETETAPKKGLM